MKRKVWMFPRNKRTAYPLEVGLLLRAFNNSLNDSAHAKLTQAEQDELNKELNTRELKTGGAPRHSQSGGPRTYISYLSQLGLIFERELPRKKNEQYITVAGQELIKLKDPEKVMLRQILRMQFPSPYSIAPNVNIDEKIRVRPAIFVCLMADDPKLEGLLTDPDLILACIYGHKDRDLNRVVQKCVQARENFRRSSIVEPRKRINQALLDVIDDAPKDLWWDLKLPRTSPEKRIDFVRDIANTLRNRLTSNNILVKCSGSLAFFGVENFCLNKSLKKQIAEVAAEGIIDKSSYRDNEGWQRRIGRGSSVKDSRTFISSRAIDLSSPDEIIKEEVLNRWEKDGTLIDESDFAKELCKKTGKSETKVLNIIREILPKSRGVFEENVIKSSSVKSKSSDFEKQLTALLKKSFKNATVEHIGRRARTDKSMGHHNFPDILFKSKSHRVMQIDTKSNERKAYAYQAGEVTKSEFYAENIAELLTHPYDEQVLFLIVSSGFTETAYDRAKGSSKRTGIPFKLIDIDELLEIIKREEPSEDGFLDKLIKHVSA